MDTITADLFSAVATACGSGSELGFADKVRGYIYYVIILYLYTCMRYVLLMFDISTVCSSSR